MKVNMMRIMCMAVLSVLVVSGMADGQAPSTQGDVGVANEVVPESIQEQVRVLYNTVQKFEARPTETKVFRNILNLKAFCIGAKNKLERAHRRKSRPSIDFVASYSKFPGRSTNIVTEYATIMGKMKAKFKFGISRYELGRMDQAMLHGNGVLETVERRGALVHPLKKGRSEILNSKALGLVRRPSYLLRFAVKDRDHAKIKQKLRKMPNVMASTNVFANAWLTGPGFKVYKRKLDQLAKTVAKQYANNRYQRHVNIKRRRWWVAKARLLTHQWAMRHKTQFKGLGEVIASIEKSFASERLAFVTSHQAFAKAVNKWRSYFRAMAKSFRTHRRKVAKAKLLRSSSELLRKWKTSRTWKEHRSKERRIERHLGRVGERIFKESRNKERRSKSAQARKLKKKLKKEKKLVKQEKKKLAKKKMNKLKRVNRRLKKKVSQEKRQLKKTARARTRQLIKKEHARKAAAKVRRGKERARKMSVEASGRRPSQVVRAAETRAGNAEMRARTAEMRARTAEIRASVLKTREPSRRRPAVLSTVSFVLKMPVTPATFKTKKASLIASLSKKLRVPASEVRVFFIRKEVPVDADLDDVLLEEETSTGGVKVEVKRKSKDAASAKAQEAAIAVAAGKVTDGKETLGGIKIPKQTPKMKVKEEKTKAPLKVRPARTRVRKAERRARKAEMRARTAEERARTAEGRARTRKIRRASPRKRSSKVVHTAEIRASTSKIRRASRKRPTKERTRKLLRKFKLWESLKGPGNNNEVRKYKELRSKLLRKLKQRNRKERRNKQRARRGQSNTERLSKSRTRSAGRAKERHNKERRSAFKRRVIRKERAKKDAAKERHGKARGRKAARERVSMMRVSRERSGKQRKREEKQRAGAISAVRQLLAKEKARKAAEKVRRGKERSRKTARDYRSLKWRRKLARNNLRKAKDKSKERRRKLLPKLKERSRKKSKKHQELKSSKERHFKEKTIKDEKKSKELASKERARKKQRKSIRGIRLGKKRAKKAATKEPRSKADHKRQLKKERAKKAETKKTAMTKKRRGKTRARRAKAPPKLSRKEHEAWKARRAMEVKARRSFKSQHKFKESRGKERLNKGRAHTEKSNKKQSRNKTRRGIKAARKHNPTTPVVTVRDVARTKRAQKATAKVGRSKAMRKAAKRTGKSAGLKKALKKAKRAKRAKRKENGHEAKEGLHKAKKSYRKEKRTTKKMIADRTRQLIKKEHAKREKLKAKAQRSFKRLTGGIKARTRKAKKESRKLKWRRGKLVRQYKERRSKLLRKVKTRYSKELDSKQQLNKEGRAKADRKWKLTKKERDNKAKAMERRFKKKKSASWLKGIRVSEIKSKRRTTAQKTKVEAARQKPWAHAKKRAQTSISWTTSERKIKLAAASAPGLWPPIRRPVAAALDVSA